MRLRSFLSVCPAVRNSIFLTQSGRKSGHIAQNVTSVCTKVHFRMTLEKTNVFSDKGVNKFEMYEGVRLFRTL